MDKKAIDASIASLMKAAAAVVVMEAAKTFAELESAWSDFLINAHRVYTKLEQGAKTNGKSKDWFGRKKHERKTDPLMRYMHHARNVDEHGLAEITERAPSSLALGVGPGSWQFDGTIGPGGLMTVTALGGQVPGVSKFMEYTPAKVRMVKVKDRGVAYDPPLGQNSADLHPLDAAKLSSYLQKMVEEAGHLVD
jgi:hypothetical protein